MTIVSASLQPSSNITAPRSLFDAWAQGISSLIQQSGIAKTQLSGFGIYNRVSMRWQSAAGLGSPSFTIPTNVAGQDVMIVSVAVATGTTVTTPTGWTAIRNDAATGGTGPVVCYLYYRPAAGTLGAPSTDGGTTFTFTVSNTALPAMASLSVYVGVLNSTPINVQGVASSSANGTTATAGALTTTVANTYVVQVLSTDSAGTLTAFTAPSGYVARTQPLATGGMVVANSVSDIFQAGAGTTGTPAWTLSSTGSWVVQTLALTPAPTFTPTVTAVTGGTLAASTVYYYRVAALNGVGSTLPCPEVSAATGTTTLSMQLSWTAVPNATGYAIYGRTTGAELLIATVGVVTTYTDTGALTPSGAMPTADTSADTGQINFGASATNPVVNTKSGFEIYQLTDSNQATYPVFIRIDYGVGATSGNPQIWIQCGADTNGSGTIQASSAYPNSLTPSTTTANMFTTGGGAWTSTSSSLMYVDSDSGSTLMIAGWANALGSSTPAGSGGACLVERTRDWNGTVNTEGVVMIAANPIGTIYGYWLFNNANQFVGPAPSASGGPCQIFIAGGNVLVPGAVGTVGSTVYVYPVPGPNTPKWNGPLRHFVACWLGDIQNGATFSITQYGATHTFLKTNGLLVTNLCACARIT